MKLEEISNIYAGVVPSRKQATEQEQKHKYKLISLKSISKFGTINPSDFTDYYTKDKLALKYLVKNKDIIVRIRPPIYAGVIDDDFQDVAIPSYCINLRLNKDHINKILPEFIALYINSKKAQKEFNKDIVGTMITMIKPTSIRKLEIPIIPMNKQKQILRISKILNKELKLLKELIELKEKYYNQINEKLVI